MTNKRQKLNALIECPKCKNKKCCKCGFTAESHKQRYMCSKCKAQFLLNPSKRIYSKSNLGLECPICSKTHIQKCGFSRSGKQKYVCVDCKRRFVLNPHIRTHVYKVNSLTQKQTLTEEKALILATRKPQTGNSIIDVPCFMCPYQEKDCNPKTCRSLTLYLTETPELKLMAIPTEETLKPNIHRNPIFY